MLVAAYMQKFDELKTRSQVVEDPSQTLMIQDGIETRYKEGAASSTIV